MFPGLLGSWEANSWCCDFTQGLWFLPFKFYLFLFYLYCSYWIFCHWHCIIVEFLYVFTILALLTKTYLLSWIHLLSNRSWHPPASICQCPDPLSTCACHLWVPTHGPQPCPPSLLLLSSHVPLSIPFGPSPLGPPLDPGHICSDVRPTVLFSVFFLVWPHLVLKACLCPKRKLFPCLLWLMYSVTSVKPLASPDRQLERKFLSLELGHC